MKIFCTCLFASFLTFSGRLPNKTVQKVDLHRFSGTWFSLASIPTIFDSGSRETTTYYTLNGDGYYNVVTTCLKPDGSVRSVTSKIFPDNNDAPDGKMEAQFIWPIKIDYWVVALANDYSWAVVGHPDHRFLFILSRKPQMDRKLYNSIVARCREMGYPVDKLVLQQFPHELL